MISKYLAMGRKICRDDLSKIENYDKAIADTTQKWHCHHRLETHRYTDRTRTKWERREKDISSEMLKMFGVYYHRPAEELIFLLPDEHIRLHHKGKIVSEETRRKDSEAHKGKKASEETKQKMSETMKGNKYRAGKKSSDETKRKISEAMKGRQFSEETRRKLSKALTGRKFSEEHKRKIGESSKGRMKGKHWKLVDGKRVWY